MLIEEAEKWKGTLVGGEEARNKCVEKMRLLLDSCNTNFPKCKPCCMGKHENGFNLSVRGVVDSTFVMLTFNKVRSSYDGITHGEI